MRTDTAAGRTAITLLTPFRRLSDRTGEGGAFLMMGVPLFTAFTLLDPSPSRIPLNMVCIAVMAIVSLAVFARAQDGEGHRAMRRMLKTHEKNAGRRDPDYTGGLVWLGLPTDATVEDIKRAVRVMVKRHHSKSGPQAMDMDKLMTFRDRMIAYATASEPAPAAPDAATLLSAYEERAGRLGVAWGHMFPTERLKGLGYR